MLLFNDIRCFADWELILKLENCAKSMQMILTLLELLNDIEIYSLFRNEASLPELAKEIIIKVNPYGS